MHPDNDEQRKEFYIETQDGERVKIVNVYGGIAAVPVDLLEADAAELEAELEIEEIELIRPAIEKMQREQEKKARCGSRKRFVKLMMADGCGRNEANEMADLAQEWFLPWRVAYWWF